MPRIFRFTMTENEFDHLLVLLEAGPAPDDPLVYRLKARQLLARSKRLEADRAQPPPVTETRTKTKETT